MSSSPTENQSAPAARLTRSEAVVAIQRPAGDDFLAPEEVRKLTPEVLVQRALALKPLLAERARAAEKERRPDETVWAEMRRAGFFYQFVPRRFGGMEVTPEQFLDVMLPLSEGDPSTSWVINFCAMHNWYLSQFPEQAQAEIWGKRPYVTGPDVTFPPGSATRDGAGYRVTGRWKWGTGVMNADWIFCKAVFSTPDGPDVGHFVFPSEEAKVIDVWHVDGMSATGSNDIVVSELWIPEHRMTPLRPAMMGRGPGTAAHPDSQLYRMPALPLLSLGAGIPALGAGRATVAAFQDRLLKHVTVGMMTRQMDRTASQMRLGKADIMVRTAERIFRASARETFELAHVRDEARRRIEVTRVRADLAHAVHMCREAIGMLCDSAGSSLHYLSNPMQRYKRDVDVISTHIVFDMDVGTEELGRARLGLPPASALA
jgi:alkylation response protein AidB-like acyl-CoA dehydrogenase